MNGSPISWAIILTFSLMLAAVALAVRLTSLERAAHMLEELRSKQAWNELGCGRR